MTRLLVFHRRFLSQIGSMPGALIAWLVLLSLGTAGGLAAASMAPAREAGGAQEHKRCPAGFKLLASRQVIAYTRSHGRTLQVCDRHTGNHRTLDFLSAGDHWWPPPAMALRGRFFAYSLVYNPEGTGAPGAQVRLVRLPRHGDFAYTAIAPITSALDGLSSDLVQVQRVVIRAPSRLAWTQCPFEVGVNLYDVTHINPPPRCEAGGTPNYSPGDAKEVVMFTARPPYQLRVLEKSNGIDPDSLRLHGATLSWLNNGQRRTALLR